MGDYDLVDGIKDHITNPLCAQCVFFVSLFWEFWCKGCNKIDLLSFCANLNRANASSVHRDLVAGCSCYPIYLKIHKFCVEMILTLVVRRQIHSFSNGVCRSLKPFLSETWLQTNIMLSWRCIVHDWLNHTTWPIRCDVLNATHPLKRSKGL